MIVDRLPDGKPSRMIGIHTDKIGRKKVEEDYKLLFYDNPMPMWTFDPETHKFLDVNNAAVNHYGYSRDEFLNMTLLDIRPKEDAEKLKISIGDNGKTNSGSNELW